jgi:hypothetical protein
VGADPAYGSSDWADRFCIQVFRCYADGMEQVAEFATSELNTFQFAWVICYLAGAYGNSLLNLEVNGPGQAVINEMRNLRRQAMSLPPSEARHLNDVLGNMQHYLWRRNDSFGISNSIGWVTTHSSKERMLNYLKDYFERGMLKVYSEECIDEMKGIVRDGGTIAATGRSKDDRVIASALATAAFAEQLQPRLIANRVTKDKKESKSDENEQGGQVQVQKQVSNYLKALGF